MIISIEIHRCPKCDSSNIIKNGCDYKRAQKYHCKNCRAYGTLLASRPYSDTFKDLIIGPIGNEPACAGSDVFLVSPGKPWRAG